MMAADDARTSPAGRALKGAVTAKGMETVAGHCRCPEQADSGSRRIGNARYGACARQSAAFRLNYRQVEGESPRQQSGTLSGR